MMSAGPRILSTSGGRRAVQIIRLKGCAHYPDAPGRRLDFADVTVILPCADCGESRIAIAGELGEVIDELVRLRDLLAAPAAVPGPPPAMPEPPADAPPAVAMFARWLARQERGTIQPPPRPPREQRAATGTTGET
jgi:hypothetical protein